jgi:hypothetical protein
MKITEEQVLSGFTYRRGLAWLLRAAWAFRLIDTVGRMGSPVGREPQR